MENILKDQLKRGKYTERSIEKGKHARGTIEFWEYTKGSVEKEKWCIVLYWIVLCVYWMEEWSAL